MFSPSRSFPLFHRFAALLALVAMLVPAVTMLVHHPVALPMTSAMQMSMPGMEKCGMAMMPSPQNPAPDAPAKKPVCPICQSLQLLSNGGGIVPPVPVILIALLLSLVSYIAAGHAFCVAIPPAPQCRPRAPPVPA